MENDPVAPPVHGDQFKTLIVIVVGLIFFSVSILGAYWLGRRSKQLDIYPLVPPTEEQVACTLDAKICPDGSSVGRSGPNCEFAECPSLGLTPEISLGTTTGNLYSNPEYGVTFTLKSEERVIECPNVNEFNDNLALWIVDTPKPEGPPQLECATEGPSDSLFMSKKSAGPQTIEEYITQSEGPSYGYTLTKKQIAISGVSGTQVSGSRNTAVAAPLPKTVDQMLFENNDAFYVVPFSYTSRDFSFTK